MVAAYREAWEGGGGPDDWFPLTLAVGIGRAFWFLLQLGTIFVLAYVAELSTLPTRRSDDARDPELPALDHWRGAEGPCEAPEGAFARRDQTTTAAPRRKSA
jgi:hypothetical protein